MIDLKDLDVKAEAEKGAVLELRHPVSNDVLLDDKGKPFTLTLAGMDSNKFQKARKELAEKSRGKNKKDDAEIGVDLLVASTIDCHLILDGKKVLTNQLPKIYEQYNWIAEQAIQFMADRGNFIKA